MSLWPLYSFNIVVSGVDPDLNANGSFIGGVIIVVCIWFFVLRPIGRMINKPTVDVDEMTGTEYEKYAAEFLESIGFKTTLTKASSDFGIDIIAKRKGKTYAVQVKRQKTPVSRRAFSDAVAGRIHYGCDRAMVITNSTFTKGAEALAESTDCELIENLS